MNSLSNLLLIAMLFFFTTNNIQAQNQTEIPVKNGTEHAISDWLTFNEKQTREQNNNDLRMAWQSVFDLEKGFSIIVEASDLNSFAYYNSGEVVSLQEGGNRIINVSDDFHDLGGFAIGLKAAKTIKRNVFGSKATLDIITGFVYNKNSAHQFSENATPFLNANPIISSPFSDPTPLIDIIFVSELQQSTTIRDIHNQSIAIPVELRTNIFIGNFILSPILGLALEIPFNNSQLYYEHVYVDNILHKGNSTTLSPIETNLDPSLTVNSKLEIAYQLPFNHKIKLAVFSNLNLGQSSYSIRNHLSTQGFQLGYEVPFPGKQKE